MVPNTVGRSLAFVVLSFALALPALAQDTGTGDRGTAQPSDDVRTNWNEYEKARRDLGLADVSKDPARIETARTAFRNAETRFRESFAKSDWNRFDATKDRDLLDRGLLLTGRYSLSTDPSLSVRAYDTYVTKFKDTPETRDVIGHRLPMSYLHGGDTSRALTHWEKYASDKDPWISATSNLYLGDLAASRGDLDSARGYWKKAYDVKVTTGGTPTMRNPHDEADLRLALIGKPAPAIQSTSWVGGSPIVWTSLRGKPVVVHVMHTWCDLSREAIPNLQKNFEANKDKGLVVLGVTYLDDRGGFIPKPGSPSDGSFCAVTKETLPSHLETFRTNAGITYPFAIVEPTSVKGWRVSNRPEVFVVDRKGDVVWIGSGGDPMLDTVVTRVVSSETTMAK